METIITLLSSATAQGLLWSFLALGVFLTFRILDIPDMTAEGSFPLGGGIAAVAITSGVSPVVATLLGLLGGTIAGLVTALLHTVLKIPALLAGIITMTGLFSITSRIMNAPNIPLLGENTIFSFLQNAGLTKQVAVIIIGLLLAILVLIVLQWFFKTELGLSLRATGDNPMMAQTNGISNQKMRVAGYMISNGLVALSGALLVQNNGFADVNSGIGTIVIGLASVIIGEVLFKKAGLLGQMIAIVVGSVLYRLILGIVFEFNVEPTDTKLASALVLILALSLPRLKLRKKN
ncbi:ABC transporter permease [Enterococcus timonensis]|uniref:ABC transporter permease n=1 Tax=Enterococcus timonensis TaxID=1852364 RepID=UPI0008DA3BD9|nr:ABC transporter permease [Enterococcus timonensis]